MSLLDVERLIYREQDRSGGALLAGVSVERYLSKIKSRSDILTHYSEGECVGFVSFYCNDPEKIRGYITMLLVSPDFRGRGVASMLMDYAIEVCRARGLKECALEVYKSNQKAVSLYKKKGFLEVESGQDKQYMKVDLS